jgi:DNA-binding IclR family transcriptional regulator
MAAMARRSPMRLKPASAAPAAERGTTEGAPLLAVSANGHVPIGRTPAVQRTVRILDYLSVHPGQSFSLSHLSRALDITKATAHSLLNTLVDAGLLLRHAAGPSYSLGPATVALGEAALAQFPAIGAARREMYRLAMDTGYQALLSTVMGSEILVVATTSVSPSVVDWSLPGHRAPFTPPMGTVFVAWTSPEEVRRWLDRSGASPATRERYVNELAMVRARGYGIGAIANEFTRLKHALDLLSEDASASEVRSRVNEVLEEIRREEVFFPEVVPDGTYTVTHLSAPIFGPGGSAEIGVMLHGFPEPVTGQEIERLGRRLVQATSEAMAAAGRTPAG